jgi:hypothetical protein
VKSSVVSGSNAPPFEPVGDAAGVGVGVSIGLDAGELLTVAAALGGEPLPQALSTTTVAKAAIKRTTLKRWREGRRYAGHYARQSRQVDSRLTRSRRGSCLDILGALILPTA